MDFLKKTQSGSICDFQQTCLLLSNFTAWKMLASNFFSECENLISFFFFQTKNCNSQSALKVLEFLRLFFSPQKEGRKKRHSFPSTFLSYQLSKNLGQLIEKTQLLASQENWTDDKLFSQKAKNLQTHPGSYGTLKTFYLSGMVDSTSQSSISNIFTWQLLSLPVGRKKKKSSLLHVFLKLGKKKKRKKKKEIPLCCSFSTSVSVGSNGQKAGS